MCLGVNVDADTMLTSPSRLMRDIRFEFDAQQPPDGIHTTGPEETRLAGKSKIEEEEESSGGESVSGDVDNDVHLAEEDEDAPGGILGAVEVPMGVGPRDPRLEVVVDVDGHDEGAEWQTEAQLRRSEGHEAEVTIDVEAGAGGLKHFEERSTLLEESADGEDTVDRRAQAEEDWPDEDGTDGHGGHIC